MEDRLEFDGEHFNADEFESACEDLMMKNGVTLDWMAELRPKDWIELSIGWMKFLNELLLMWLARRRLLS